jgi:thymidine kinase
MLLENGCMTPGEFELFEGLYNKLAWKPDLFIYLRTTPETCKERILKRQRACETSIDIEYLKSLHEQYEALYARGIVCVNANRSVDKVYEDVVKIISPFHATTSALSASA